MPRPIVVAALAISCLASRALIAQTPAPLDEMQPGARVRVTAPGIVTGRYVGTVLARSGDTLTIGRASGLPVAVPTSRITSVEISRGKSRSAGAKRGVAWGVPIGLAAGFAFATVPDPENCYCNTDRNRNADVVLGVVSGVLWGAGIGALIGRERWEPFDIQRRTAIGITPDGATVGVRYEF
jgi:hypothetical protein